ncbi:hypothetical protein LEP1GSC125_0118 [Leptospira mayottensis 200901122]|uniref:Insertion element IS402-like domain-containing protein n=2 Tax=Leptospira mayottensis TaxID=1137606 RepID=A0AA87MPM3_9LEPT|nr:hypothetical protein LEP1GSC125_0118 [Leptospira mayottensis 200901122]
MIVMSRLGDLTNEQWDLLCDLLVEPEARDDGKGRPRVNSRSILDGILWILRTGAPWIDLPDRYPAYQTCHRRFQEWRKNGTLDKILEALLHDLEIRGKMDLSTCFIDGTFAPGKKGAHVLAKLNGERVQKSWLSSTKMVFLSPPGLKVLRRMKVSSRKAQSSAKKSKAKSKI